MLTKLRNRNKGFTIIEVLIVLAIAGLILMVVFLAVPALQRNSRNTQRKNDVANILSAVAEVASNKTGALATTDEAAIEANVKLGYYTAANISFTATAATNNLANAETVVVVLGGTCGNGAGTGAGTDTSDSVAGGSARAVAALYSVEGGTVDELCQAS